MSNLKIGLTILTYFIAAIPFGILVAKAKGVNLRAIGSGNIGATNVYRALGAKFGSLVLILDALKGGIPTYISQIIGPEPGFHICIALIAVIAHSLSCFVKFKGGKGVATGLGVIVALNPMIGGILVVIAGALIYKTRYVALTSIVCSMLTPLLFYFLNSPKEYTIMMGLIGLFIIIRHRSNIVRLINGTENKV